MAKGITRREWIAETERATKQRQPENVRAAARVFQKELSVKEQMNLLEELVETRAPELCRAYRNVIDVCVGYRGRRDKKSGKQKVVSKPCIIFIVKKKWSEDKGQDKGEKIPQYIFAYWSVKRKRKLCAIPTDVDDSAEYVAMRPQAGTEGISVVWPGAVNHPTPGAITCAVRRSGPGNRGRVYALSCRHVLSLSRFFHHVDTVGSAVFVGAGPTVAKLGETCSIAGPLRNRPQLSFDAQLAEVIDTSALWRTLDTLRFSGYAKFKQDIPKTYWIVTPRGRVKATRRSYLSRFQFSYEHEQLTKVVHRQLVLSLADTKRGDSGSPVVTKTARGLVLLGMHIAGNERGWAYMIPAWQLMHPGSYGRKWKDEKWKLL